MPATRKMCSMPCAIILSAGENSRLKRTGTEAVSESAILKALRYHTAGRMHVNPVRVLFALFQTALAVMRKPLCVVTYAYLLYADLMFLSSSSLIIAAFDFLLSCRVSPKST